MSRDYKELVAEFESIVEEMLEGQTQFDCLNCGSKEIPSWDILFNSCGEFICPDCASPELVSSEEDSDLEEAEAM